VNRKACETRVAERLAHGPAFARSARAGNRAGDFAPAADPVSSCRGIFMTASFAGIPAFAAYLATVAGLCALFLVIYVRLTPHREFDLIVHEHNASAALALGMSLVGFALPLASTVFHSVGIVDCVIWGVVALVTQVLAYFLAQLAHPNISESIRQNSFAGALWLGFVSITAGILSAACMSP
jgi:putative membrane protein